jgi:hypothetical protein
VRQGHHHILGGYQILGREVFMIDQDFGSSLVAEGIADVFEFVADDFEQSFGTGQDV